MRVTVLDDYFDTLRTLDSFARLAGHDVTVWTDHRPPTSSTLRCWAEDPDRGRTPLPAGVNPLGPGPADLAPAMTYLKGS
ncbi:MAG: hypothetical protein NVSMB12_14300 [Acidimicrobiales bacterium]